MCCRMCCVAYCGAARRRTYVLLTTSLKQFDDDDDDDEADVAVRRITLEGAPRDDWASSCHILLYIPYDI